LISSSGICSPYIGVESSNLSPGNHPLCADAFVEQQRLNGRKEWQEQLEAHNWNLIAMEAKRSAGLPGVKSEDPCGRFLLGNFIVLMVFLLIFRSDLFSAIKL
jgi:hypothetical protein